MSGSKKTKWYSFSQDKKRSTPQKYRQYHEVKDQDELSDDEEIVQEGYIDDEGEEPPSRQIPPPAGPPPPRHSPPPLPSPPPKESPPVSDDDDDDYHQPPPARPPSSRRGAADDHGRHGGPVPHFGPFDHPWPNSELIDQLHGVDEDLRNRIAWVTGGNNLEHMFSDYNHTGQCCIM